jgi:hypothetical protein
MTTQINIKISSLAISFCAYLFATKIINYSTKVTNNYNTKPCNYNIFKST